MSNVDISEYAVGIVVQLGGASATHLKPQHALKSSGYMLLPLRIESFAPRLDVELVHFLEELSDAILVAQIMQQHQFGVTSHDVNGNQ